MFITVKRLIILSFILLVPFLSEAQRTLSTKSKKAIEYYREADNFWVRGQFTMASELLQKAIDKDDEFYEAYFRLGLIEKSKGNTSLAENYLLKVVELNKDNAGANFELGELFIQTNNYKKAKEYIQNYLDLNPRNAERRKEAEQILQNANYSLENINREAEINKRPLPDHINQYAMQYFPVITADQEYLIYTRRLGTTMNHDEDLVIAKWDSLNNEWGQPESISENINSGFNEGTCTISADGRILIFTSCYGRNGYGSCDLYISKKTGDNWSVPENLGSNVNSSAWDSQPSLSADGRTLYFISNRPGGIGKRDVWVSKLGDDDIWSKPDNLGDVINTRDDEVSPFIHSNGKTFYFASNGVKGFGGFDIFYSELENNQWQEPKNLGYPINTGEDQVSLFISADGETGYYSHENLSNPNVKGEIYQFTVPKDVRVKYKAKYVKGKVFDSNTKEPLAAKVELYDLEQDSRLSMVYSDSISGEYLMVLPEGTDYAFYVTKKGYLFKSLSFQSDSLNSLLIDIPLDKAIKGSKTTLQNIFFDVDEYELKPASKTELNKVISFLKDNPKLNIEIAGHTDDQGTADYNKALSEKRAKSVYDFLISKGISQTRLRYIGYGQTQPLKSNDTPLGRQFNRRIDFEILQ